MTDREFLRHTVATLAYRAAKTMRGAPATFAGFRPGPTSKTPVEIVAHMGDLMDWGLAMAQGAPMKGESYNRADIVAGRVGPDQTPAEPRYEFD